jgi:multiple sugar transport system substrate-binding protein
VLGPYYEEVVIPQFEAAYPHIKVELTLGAWTDVSELYPVWMAGDAMPDVAQAGGTVLGSLIGQGIAAPLDRFMLNWKDKAQFVPPAMMDGEVNGHQYSVPFRIDQRVLAYRRDFFAEAGLDPDQPPTTWDELTIASRRLVQRDSNGVVVRGGFMADPHWHIFTSFLYHAGGDFLTPDLKSAAFNNAAGVEAMEYHLSLVPDRGPAWAGGIETGKTSMQFHSDVAMEWITSGRLSSDELGIAHQPYKVKKTSPVFVNKWFMSTSTRYPEAAWAWIEFVSRADVMVGIARKAGYLAPRLDILTRFEPWTADSRYAVYYEAAMLATPFTAAKHPLFETILNQYIRPAFDATFRMEQSVKALFDDAARQVNALLQTWGK